jgi:YHS domain-containing protein
MSWSPKHALPLWMLNAVTTAGLLAAPSLLPAQSKPYYQGGRVVRPAPAQTPAQPVAPAAATGTTGGETAVQAELRRLYEESGREMPEMPQNVQMQAQKPGVPPAPISPPDDAAESTQPGVVPKPSAPVSKKPNPVTSFFKKLVPGGQSKPKPSVASNTPPKASAPSVPPVPHPAPNYAPYGSQPPRRLPMAATTAAAPAASSMIPPSPAPVLEAPPAFASTGTAAAPAPAAQPQGVARLKTETVARSTIPKSTPKPAPKPPAQPRPAEPVFEAPLVIAAPVETFSPPVTKTEVIEVATAAPTQVVQTESFPDPFTELSEEEADDVGEMELAASPFSGLKLDEEPVSDADPFDLAELEPPSAAAPASEPMEPVFELPEPTAPITAATVLAPDAPVLPAPIAPKPKTAVAATEAPRLPAPKTAALELPPLTADAPVLPAPKAKPFEPVTLPAPTAVAANEVPVLPPLATKSDEPLLLPEPTATTPFVELPELPAPTTTLVVPETVELPAPQPIVIAPALPAPPSSVPVLETAPHELPKTQPRNAQPAAPVTMNAETKPISAAPSEEYLAKMAKIRERGAMKGLKGFCPVTLRDERELKDAQSTHHSSFRGQKFHFATAEAKAKFDTEPVRYAPAAYGADVVVLIRDKDVAEGTLDFAAWFKGQLYLFATETSHNTFLDDPVKFASPVGIE